MNERLEQNVGSERTTNITRQDLIKKLSDAGIDPSIWGQGKAKTVEDLLQEVNDGEIELISTPDGTLVRKVPVVTVDVMYTDALGRHYKLVESRQVFTDGRERHRDRNTSVAEKLKVGENVAEAALRGVQEELGISGEIQLTEDGREITELDSPSFPDLRSQYEIFKFSAELTPGQYKPEGYIERQPDKSTYFEWEEVKE